MEAKYVQLFLYIFCVLSCTVNSWMFSNTNVDVDDDHGMDQHVGGGDALITRSIPFEINTADDKFLLEASIAKDLSSLDVCHHRVISELEGRCADLSEEELAKLSVGLFNCQAAVEKRPTYSCTSDMAIADCTHDMDSTTWNAYQVYKLSSMFVIHMVPHSSGIRSRQLGLLSQELQFRQPGPHLL